MPERCAGLGVPPYWQLSLINMINQRQFQRHKLGACYASYEGACCPDALTTSDDRFRHEWTFMMADGNDQAWSAAALSRAAG